LLNPGLLIPWIFIQSLLKGLYTLDIHTLDFHTLDIHTQEQTLPGGVITPRVITLGYNAGL
jgi:hypothetical protein